MTVSTTITMTITTRLFLVLVLVLLGGLDPLHSFVLIAPTDVATSKKRNHHRRLGPVVLNGNSFRSWKHNHRNGDEYEYEYEYEYKYKSSSLVLLSSSTRRSNNNDNNNSDKEKDNFSDLGLLQTPDYLITDSLELDDADRPTLLEFAFVECPTEGFVRGPFLVCGAALSVCNVMGTYDERIYAPLVLACVVLGVCNAMVDAFEPTRVSANVRRGSIDSKVLQLYAGTYSVSVCWLAMRVYPPVCPEWLPPLDPVLGMLASIVFLASLGVPLSSLASDLALPAAERSQGKNAFLEGTQTGLIRLVRGKDIQRLPPFTPIETYRAIALVVIGCVACLYLPVSSYLAVYGSTWWDMYTLSHYPRQGLLETSTALFGLTAAEANFLITRAAAAGVRPVAEMANLGIGACLVLTVVPCASALYFLQSGTTFFEHYRFYVVS